MDGVLPEKKRGLVEVRIAALMVATRNPCSVGSYILVTEEAAVDGIRSAS